MKRIDLFVLLSLSLFLLIASNFSPMPRSSSPTVTFSSARPHHRRTVQQLGLLGGFVPVIVYLLRELDWSEVSRPRRQKLDAVLSELADAVSLTRTITHTSTKSPFLYPENEEERLFWRHGNKPSRKFLR